MSINRGSSHIKQARPTSGLGSSSLDYGQRGLGPATKLKPEPQVKTGGNGVVMNGPMVRVPFPLVSTSVKPTEVVEPVVTSQPGAFFLVYQDTGVWYLQGGQVMGGTGNKTISNINLATVGAEPADGTKRWVEITGDGVTDAGVLLPGYNITAAIVPSAGATLPANTLPTASSATGKKAYVLLGEWLGSVFYPAQTGNIAVTFCPGAYTITRA